MPTRTTTEIAGSSESMPNRTRPMEDRRLTPAVSAAAAPGAPMIGRCCGPNPNWLRIARQASDPSVLLVGADSGDGCRWG